MCVVSHYADEQQEPTSCTMCIRTLAIRNRFWHGDQSNTSLGTEDAMTHQARRSRPVQVPRCLQQARVQRRASGSHQQLVQLFSKNKSGQKLSKEKSCLHIQGQAWNIDIEDRSRKPGPMVSFMRHVTFMQSPNNPSHLNRSCP